MTSITRSVALAAALATGVLSMTACTTTPPMRTQAEGDQKAVLNTQVKEAMTRLYAVEPATKDMIANSAGVLVFPRVLGASMGIGAEIGRGALMVKGEPVEYYNTTAASIGFQAGAQSRAIFYIFRTPDALAKFRESRGWSAGVDATVAVATAGANAKLDTQNVNSSVVAVVLTNAGLEYGLSLQGAKISRIDL